MSLAQNIGSQTSQLQPVPRTQLFRILKSRLSVNSVFYSFVEMFKMANNFCLKGLDCEFIIMFDGYLLITFHCNLNTLWFETTLSKINKEM